MQISDQPRPPREPMLNLPGVVSALILALVAIHGLRLLLDDASDFALLVDLSVIPARFAVALDPMDLGGILREVEAQGGAPGEVSGRLAYARYVLEDAAAQPWTALTYAFLHGSWGHVLLNAVWLAAFGSPVARRVGAPRLLALAAAGAVGGALAHVLANPHAIGPMIGASAAVSGLMAAAARFVFAPPTVHEDIDRFLPPHLKPRESLRGLLANRRAALFIGIWFVTNALFGIFAEPLGLVDSGIAWEAHMGGFVAGLLLFPLLDPVPDRRRADLGA